MPDITEEKAVIDSATPLDLSQMPVVGRCSLCGQPARVLQLIEAFQYESGHSHERYRGECCAPHPHRESEEVR